MEQLQNSITTIIGHKGYGKTTLTGALLFLQDKPVIIADPRYQYSTDQKRRWFFKTPGVFRVWIKENYLIFRKFKLECVVHTTPENFHELCEIVEKMTNICFCIDEVDMFFSVRADFKNPVYKLVHYGRHKEIDIISTSRRPANISRNLTSQTDIFYFSRLREPNDKKYLKELTGYRDVEIAESLERFTFLKLDEELNRSLLKTSEKDIDLLQRA